jgi:translation initiation factor 2 gamma subunit (eIF-2gamma)
MDAALLCIESVETQTSNHLVMGECIGISNWIVVQTKADLLPLPLPTETATAATNAAVALLAISRLAEHSATLPINRNLLPLVARAVFDTRHDVSSWFSLTVSNYAAIKDLLVGTAAEGAPIIPVSAVKGAGLQHVLHALVSLPPSKRLAAKTNNGTSMTVAVRRIIEIVQTIMLLTTTHRDLLISIALAPPRKTLLVE